MEEIVQQIKKQQQVRAVLARTICIASPASRLIRLLFCNQAVAFFYANTRLFFCLNELSKKAQNCYNAKYELENSRPLRFRDSAELRRK